MSIWRCRVSSAVAALGLVGCSSVVVQSAWTPSVPGPHRRVTQRADEVLPPVLHLPVADGLAVDVQVCARNQGVYEVLAGPLVFPVIPIGLLSWIWAPGLDEAGLDVVLLLHGPEGRLDLDPSRFVLHAAGGERIAPRSAERLSSGPERLGMLVQDVLAGRRAPIPPELQPFHLVVRYDLPPDVERLELELGGVLLDGAVQAVPTITLARTASWRFVAPLDTSGR